MANCLSSGVTGEETPIVEAMLVVRETEIKACFVYDEDVRSGSLSVNIRQAKGGGSLQGITFRVPETISGQRLAFGREGLYTV